MADYDERHAISLKNCKVQKCFDILNSNRNVQDGENDRNLVKKQD